MASFRSVAFRAATSAATIVLYRLQQPHQILTGEAATITLSPY
ncbi:hypothetical protein [Pectobacterium sp. IFB5596]|nr:hypothetical protein [Pectobacterium sp. IFB5596]